MVSLLQNTEKQPTDRFNKFVSKSRSNYELRYLVVIKDECGSVAEWLACWTQVQKGPGSNRSRDAVG